MSRHPQLKSARIKLIEAARVKDVSVERLAKRLSVIKYKIEPDNLYNMDESGFAIGDIEVSRVLLMLQFVKYFKRSLDVKNFGSHRLSAFLPTDVRFHP